jgi:hypothetical protein
MLQTSLVEESHEFGIIAFDGDVTLESSVVRATSPQASDQLRGTGVHVQSSCATLPMGSPCDPSRFSSVVLHHALVEQNSGFGVLIIDSHANIDASAVRGTVPLLGTDLFGDGITVVTETLPASATLSATIVEDSARAGLATFGATLSLTASHIRCAEFALTIDAHAGFDPALDDRGGNLCGCPDASEACQAISAKLAPPEAPTSK